MVTVSEKIDQQDQDQRGADLFYYGTSSLFWVHCQLFISDLIRLYRKNGPYLSSEESCSENESGRAHHALQKVHLVGIIVGLDRKTSRYQITLDDGTGVVVCTYWINQGVGTPSFKLGNLISLNGKLSVYNDVLQVTITTYRIETDPNYELLHWAQVIKLKRLVYDTKFIPSFEILESNSLALQRQQLLNAKEEDSKEIDSNAEIVNDCMKETIASLNSFSFQDLISDQELVSTVESLYSVKEHQAHFIISKSLRKLVSEGFIYPVDPKGDNEIYQAVNESNLGQEILHIIEKSDIDLTGEAAIEIITSRIRQTPCYSKIPRSVVMKYLNGFPKRMDIENIENQQPPSIIEGKRKPQDELKVESSPSKRVALYPALQETLARVQEAPDHTHLSLASEAVKRRLSNRSKHQLTRQSISLPEYAPIVAEKCDSLSNPPSILIPRKAIGADKFQQISLFFSTPVPKFLCGPDDEGETMFGVAMEYHLLNLIESELSEGSFLNIAGWKDEPHVLIDQTIQSIESLKDKSSEENSNSEAVSNYKLAAWGRKASQLEKVWDGSLKELYAKKEFLTCGLYHKPENDSDSLTKHRSGPYFSDEKFSMPLPDEALFTTETDFDLSHDLYYLIDISGGPKDVRRNHIVAAPSDFVQLSENIFVDRKPRKFVEAPICMCKVNGDPSCGESCLNRCMFIECTPDCPSGDQCTNRRFQTPNTGKNLLVVRCHGRGYGIESAEPISKGEFIIEYRGEIINTATSKERINSLYHASSNHYFLNYGPQEVIDGYLKGTIARFVNHSCDPNCAIEKWTVDGEYRIGLFALKDIQPGTELTYDYKFESFGPLQKCLCQSFNCRGFIGLNKKEDDPTHVVKQKKSVPVFQKKINSKKKKGAGKNEEILENEEDVEVLVHKKFDPKYGGKVLQAAIRAAKTSFARGSFLIRNMKRQLKTNHILQTNRPYLGTIVEDLFLDMIDTISNSTFVLTYKGSFHVAAQHREPLPFKTKIALERNFNPKPRRQKTLESILSKLISKN